MANIYDFQIHTFVTVEGAEAGPLPILLHCSEFVFVEGHYSLVGGEIKQVGDGRCNGFDDFGCCLVSVPAGRCSYWTDDEANSIANAEYADYQLMLYARS